MPDAAAYEAALTEAPDQPLSRHGETFKRHDLVEAVSGKTGLPRAKALVLVEAVLDTISDTLRGGQEVRLVGFGAFSVTERKAGKGRDPRTGQEIDLPRSRSVRFRPGKTLRGHVADPIAGPRGG